MTAYILLGHGFEEIEAIAPGDILRRGGVDVKYVGVCGTTITGGRDIEITSDIKIDDVHLKSGDIIIIPGGMGGVESLESSDEVSALLIGATGAGASLAAICAGPRVLARLGLLIGKIITCYPGMDSEMTGAASVTNAKTELDGNLITGQAAGSAVDFGLRILEYLKGTDTSELIRGNICHG